MIAKLENNSAINIIPKQLIFLIYLLFYNILTQHRRCHDSVDFKSFLQKFKMAFERSAEKFFIRPTGNSLLKTQATLHVI